MFSEERKYVIKEKKIHKYVIDDVDSGEATLLGKIQMDKNLIKFFSVYIKKW